MSREPSQSQLPADGASRFRTHPSSHRQPSHVSALPLFLTIAFVVIAITALSSGGAVVVA